MLVKDEADIVGATVRHLAANVDGVIVADNLSTDGTYEILLELEREFPGVVSVRRDEEPAYYQALKTSTLAREAAELGYRWVVPCDADEIWYAPGLRLGGFLDSIAPDVQVVTAEMYNHLPTSEDDPGEANPVTRIGWRQRARGAMFKVAARAQPDVWIEPGNHAAFYGAGLRGMQVGGLVIRHFSWRTAEQYERKIANGSRAYTLAADLDPTYGEHWKMHGSPDDPTFTERVRDHFSRWFWVNEPGRHDDVLIYDPAPAEGQLTPA